MKIVADEHIPYIEDYFGPYGDLTLLPGRSISAADVQHADLLLVRSITHVNESLLSQSNVKFVGSITAGADHLDTAWLNQAGIDWRVAVGFNAPPVSDYVISVIAALRQQGLLTAKKLKAAVIGVGKVGQRVAHRLQWLGFEVILCDPLRAIADPSFHSTPIETIAEVDLISLHVPLTREGENATYHFIDQAFLLRQKRDCVLLNASRGAVIDSQALLKYGAHLHWCFDVWEHEPKIEKQVLERAFIATPHIAGYSVQSKLRGIEMIYQLAIEQGFITAQPFSPIVAPHQQLSFQGNNLSWEEIVLGVFNPAIITTMMQSLLLPATDYGPLFDEMRNEFNYRHEISATRIINSAISKKTAELLALFGFKL